jgi:Sec-independent protein translocase protein TatA
LEILGIGPLELLMILVLALIFIGPGKMPEVAASAGKFLREFRAASAELTEALNAEIAEVERRKSEIATGENGSGHSLAEAAQAEVVAQGEVGPPPIEYSPAEVIAPAEIDLGQLNPARPPTIDDRLGALGLQEAEAAAKLEAEEQERRLAALAEERSRIGMAPLPDSLLTPSTNAPLVVVNPTELLSPAIVAPQAVEAPGADAQQTSADQPEVASTPDGAVWSDGRAAAGEAEALATSSVDRAEVF